MSQQHYTFGDTERAAARLQFLSNAFEPSSRKLLQQHGPRGVSLAVDLGCGVGRTTRLLHDVCGPDRLVGLDCSTRFLDLARDQCRDIPIEFLERDVATPGALPPADFIYSRFLVTHLRDREAVLRAWLEAVRPGTTLVCEETANLESGHPALLRYYELVAELQAHHAQQLYVGQELAALVAAAGWTLRVADIARICLPEPTMARLHAMNIATWKHDVYAAERFDAGELSYLEHELTKIAAVEDADATVQCALAQVVATAPPTMAGARCSPAPGAA